MSAQTSSIQFCPYSRNRSVRAISFGPWWIFPVYTGVCGGVNVLRGFLSGSGSSTQWEWLAAVGSSDIGNWNR